MWSLLNRGLAEKYKLFVVHNHKETDKCIKDILELNNYESNSNK